MSALLWGGVDENPRDPYSQLAELEKRFDNRLTIENLALAKRYLDGELRIGIVCSAKWLPIEFCTVFQRELPISRADGDRREYDRLSPIKARHPKSHDNAPMGRAYRD